MHELAIAEGLIRTALAALKDAPPKAKVTELEVEVGELSTAVPELLASSFAMAAQGTRLAGARLKTRKVALGFACRGCGKKFGVGPTACPACRSADVEIVAGREVRLLSLEVEEE